MVFPIENISNPHSRDWRFTCRKSTFTCLGWKAALTDSFVVKTRTSESFLKVSNIRRTQHINQVKAVVLSVFQREAYEDANENANENSFEEWRQCMINCSAAVGFCDFFIN